MKYAQTQGRNKKSRKKITLLTNCIVLPWPTYTEPRAKRVDLDPSYLILIGILFHKKMLLICLMTILKLHLKL